MMVEAGSLLVDGVRRVHRLEDLRGVLARHAERVVDDRGFAVPVDFLEESFCVVLLELLAAERNAKPDSAQAVRDLLRVPVVVEDVGPCRLVVAGDLARTLERGGFPHRQVAHAVGTLGDVRTESTSGGLLVGVVASLESGRGVVRAATGDDAECCREREDETIQLHEDLLAFPGSLVHRLPAHPAFCGHFSAVLRPKTFHESNRRV